MRIFFRLHNLQLWQFAQLESSSAVCSGFSSDICVYLLVSRKTTTTFKKKTPHKLHIWKNSSTTQENKLHDFCKQNRLSRGSLWLACGFSRCKTCNNSNALSFCPSCCICTVGTLSLSGGTVIVMSHINRRTPMYFPHEQKEEATEGVCSQNEDQLCVDKNNFRLYTLAQCRCAVCWM